MKYIRANNLKRLFSLNIRNFVEEDGVAAKHHGVLVGEEDKNDCRDGFQIASVAQRPSWRCFSFEEIFPTTNENLVGKGGYVEIYKGVLNDWKEIVVKRLTKACSDERKEKDFLTKIGTIGHVHHPNVLHC